MTGSSSCSSQVPGGYCEVVLERGERSYSAEAECINWLRQGKARQVLPIDFAGILRG